jgi:histone deacetylase 11
MPRVEKLERQQAAEYAAVARSALAMKIIYSAKSDIGWSAIKRLHPFDGQKFSRAWTLLEQRYGAALDRHAIDPAPWLDSTVALLPQVHTATYLSRLPHAITIAGIVEIPALKWVPATVLKKVILDPMLMACAGACAAAEIALEQGFSLTLGGGFHHAFADHGEGFCVFNDIALARQHLIKRGKLTPSDTVWVIDLDAHRGNGNEDIFAQTPNVYFLDLFNRAAYPGPLPDDTRFPHLLGLPEHMGVPAADRPLRSTDLYLAAMKTALAAFVAACPRPKIVFYNAGTDIVIDDPLGRMSVSDDGVAARDRHVIETLHALELPTVMLTSGGYTDKSHRLIAQTASWALERYTGLTPWQS